MHRHEAKRAGAGTWRGHETNNVARVAMSSMCRHAAAGVRRLWCATGSAVCLSNPPVLFVTITSVLFARTHVAASMASRVRRMKNRSK